MWPDPLLRRRRLPFSGSATAQLRIASTSMTSNTPSGVSCPKKDRKGLSDDEIKVVAVKKVFENFLAYLASDVRAAQIYDAPLGSAIPFHQQLLRTANSPTVAEVAMRMRLPVLEGITPDVLLRIREDEHEYFDRFRTQLRLAIQERLKAAESENPRKSRQ